MTCTGLLARRGPRWTRGLESDRGVERAEADGLVDRVVPAPWGGKLSGRAYIKHRLSDLLAGGHASFTVAAFKELLAETMALCATSGRIPYARPRGGKRVAAGAQDQPQAELGPIT
jgi:hypothetical protein